MYMCVAVSKISKAIIVAFYFSSYFLERKPLIKIIETEESSLHGQVVPVKLLLHMVILGSLITAAMIVRLKNCF